MVQPQGPPIAVAMIGLPGQPGGQKGHHVRLPAQPIWRVRHDRREVPVRPVPQDLQAVSGKQGDRGGRVGHGGESASSCAMTTG